MSDAKRNAIIIAVTGGIACGKSTAGGMLKEAGFAICDSDHIAHELMRKGTPVFQAIVRHFGTHILDAEGEISRPALGKLVFDHPTELSILNGLIHPAVRDYLRRWISERTACGENGAVLIPLLFESKMESLDWAAVLCLSSSEDQMIQRLKERGLNEEEARKRMNSQMPLKEKESRADFVIQNNTSLDDLNRMIRETVRKITA